MPFVKPYKPAVDARQLRDFVEGYEQERDERNRRYVKGLAETALALSAWTVYKSFIKPRRK